jgi:hypothetical protein
MRPFVRAVTDPRTREIDTMSLTSFRSVVVGTVAGN